MGVTAAQGAAEAGLTARVWLTARRVSSLVFVQELRPAVFALRAFNVETGLVAETAKEPALAQLRLTWWRDAVASMHERSDHHHPVVHALAAVRAASLTHTPRALLVNAISSSPSPQLCLHLASDFTWQDHEQFCLSMHVPTWPQVSPGRTTSRAVRACTCLGLYISCLQHWLKLRSGAARPPKVSQLPLAAHHQHSNAMMQHRLKLCSGAARPPKVSQLPLAAHHQHQIR